MSLFKILKGESSRISTDTTPFHDGWAYFTPDDGGFYIDVAYKGEQKRTRINPSGGGSKAICRTLLESDWIGGRQVLLIDGLKAEQNGVIGIAQGISDPQMAAAKEAELYVYNQIDGAVTVACFGDVPKVDIPIVIILLA